MGPTLIILAIISGVTMVVSLAWPSIRKHRRLSRFRARPRYRKTRAFLNEIEREMLGALQDMVGPSLLVFPCIRLFDLLELVGGEEHNNIGLAQRLRSEVVDFAIIDRKTSMPMLVVELRNPAEEDAALVERQQFIESTLSTAGVPVLPISRVSPRTSLQLAETIQTSLSDFIRRASSTPSASPSSSQAA